MNKLANYIGQLRLYSLVDLALLLIASMASKYEFIGALLLHISFIAYLESNHKHKYRESIPNFVWIILIITGTIFYKHIEVIPFIIFSFLYSSKNKDSLGAFAPLFRGLQVFFLIGGIAGYSSIITWLALPLTFIRNLAGDMRDITKDKKEKMTTLPIILGMKEDIKYLHFIMLIITSIIWWTFTPLSWMWIIGTVIIQALTYNLTAR